MNPEEFLVSELGSRTIPSPLNLSHTKGDGVYDYIDDAERILYDVSYINLKKNQETGINPISFEKAGPLAKIYFDPSKTKAAIVTCGGLCPGLNDVIRGVVMQLQERYGVENILGIKYGYAGLVPESKLPFIELDSDMVDEIQHKGGSILGSSRGNQDVSVIVNTLERENIHILFCVGGDGTLRGAQAIAEEINKRGLKIAVAGIPKTIDNDINFIRRSFGFETAFSIATDIIRDCHNEAKGYFNGISLIKLMGRDSGFIAAHTALAQQDVNFVLVPEMDFDLDGPNGFIEALRKRLERKNHAVVVVAEGAGQKFFNCETEEKDLSGNILHKDIGLYLRDKITTTFKNQNFPFSLKYIDPSYIIRSAPANANDSMFCNMLAQNAVHAAMAGKTSFVVGYWNSQFTLLPISLAVKERKKIDTESDFWGSVIGTTRQPVKMNAI